MVDCRNVSCVRAKSAIVYTGANVRIARASPFVPADKSRRSNSQTPSSQKSETVRQLRSQFGDGIGPWNCDHCLSGQLSSRQNCCA